MTHAPAAHPAHPAKIAPDSASLRAWTLPRTAAQRSIYRSSLSGLLADLLFVSVLLARDPAGRRHPQLGATLQVPSESRLRFTADGWVRITLQIVPLDALACARVHDPSPASRPSCASISLHTRIAESVESDHLFVEWRSPSAGTARQSLKPAAGAATPSAGPQILTLSLPLVGETPSPKAMGLRRPRRTPPPRRVTVQRIFRGNARMPALRLSGKWLSQLGFTERQSIAVSAEPGRIVLSLVPPSPANPSRP